jgi:predicted O-linked N-acetylglucosamine transferase (SPINDLY family)
MKADSEAKEVIAASTPNESPVLGINGSIALQTAIKLHQEGALDSARRLYERILVRFPDHPDALHLLGVISHQRGNHEEAISFISRAISLNPLQAFYRANFGNVLRSLNRPGEALASYDEAIRLKSDYASAFFNRGNVLKELNRLEDALSSYDDAIRCRPDYFEALNNRGSVLKDLHRPVDALRCYDEVIRLKPGYSDGFNNRGNILKHLGRLEDALASYDEAVRINPDHADALNNRGNVLKELGRFDEALGSYDLAISLRPDFESAFYNRGNALKGLKRFDEALASYKEALRLKPNHAATYNNQGNLLKEIKRFDEALESYDSAIRLNANYVDALNNRGNLLKELGRFEEARSCYEEILRLDAQYPFAPGMAAHMASFVCRWDGFPRHIQAISKSLHQGHASTPPFPLLAMIDDPALHRRAAELYVHQRHRSSGLLGPLSKRQQSKRIHVAYLSGDFHNHATSYLIAGLLELHDRQKFRVTGVSFGPSKRDGMRMRVEKALDDFLEVTDMSDIAVSQLCREMEVDIAVDLKGFTQDSRTGILAERCAPIQVNWLGFPGSMGSDFIDYIVADRILIEEKDLGHYTEKVIWMPHSYQVNDSKRLISDRQFSRVECGLPERGFVFCSFNNNYKILPDTFDVWMKVLSRVPGSVLWLLAGNPSAVANLRSEAAARGLDADRLVFADRMPLADHLARHRLADLFLDNWPYNAHTTASDALWAGLPLITLRGESFPARVAASLLGAVGLPELVTRSVCEYEDLAVALAMNPATLASLKKKLTDNVSTAPLFDSVRYTRNLESAYTRIMQRYWKGDLPDHLSVTE